MQTRYRDDLSTSLSWAWFNARSIHWREPISVLQFGPPVARPRRSFDGASPLDLTKHFGRFEFMEGDVSRFIPGFKQQVHTMIEPIVKRRLIVAISGASGFIYGLKALKLLRLMEVETHLVISQAGQITRAHETEFSRQHVEAQADVHYPIGEVGAAITSGSFATMGMLIAPCSMRTLAGIATGVTDSLVTRAADVTLKERRRLVLMAPETPLHLIHLRNMQAVTECGGVVFPPVPAFHTHPTSLDDIVTHSVARALDLFGLETPHSPRLGEDNGLGLLDPMRKEAMG